MTDLAGAQDEQWMRKALEQAERAAVHGDVPVGAALVGASGELIAVGCNRRERDADPTAHAEIVAMRKAAAERGEWRLVDTTLYVTLEPCLMCAGALLQARVARVVYGCADDKAGAVDSLFTVGRDPRLPHRFTVRRGVLAAECAALLKQFFGPRR